MVDIRRNHAYAIEWISWLAVLSLAAVLCRERYLGAVARVGPDFLDYYIPAAAELARGGNPYSIYGYNYSPLVALLLAPFSGVEVARQFQVWSVVMVACICGAALSVSLWPGLNGWRRALLAGFATFTALHFWPTTLELFFGQADAAVLFVFSWAIVAVMHGRQHAAAVLLGLGGVLKSWPIVFGAGLLGRPWRPRAWVTLVVVGLAAPGLAWVMGGLSWVSRMATGTAANASQPLINHSIFSVVELNFGRTGLAQPLLESPALAVVLKVLLVTVLVVTFIALLRRGPDQQTALVHAAGTAVLLVPVSHLVYMIYVLPMTWFWAHRVLVRQNAENVVGFLVATTWWLVVEMPWPDKDSPPTLPSTEYSVVFVVTYGAVVASAWMVRTRRLPDTSEHAPSGSSVSGAAS